MKYYSIAGLTLQSENLEGLDPHWHLFEADASIEYEYLLQIESTANQDLIHGVFHISEENKYFHYLHLDGSLMAVTDNWKKGTFLLSGSQVGKSLIILQMYYTHAVKRHFIQIHSSLINYRGRGLLFLGPSGIGKTTQAELWQKYRDAQIINGDLAFVQKTENEFLGWGTPWHGSSPYCMNASVPVAALIVLKQAEKNSLRRLTGFTMVSEVSQSVFYPLWLEGGTELCLETLDALLRQIPVYELACRPDEASVSLLYRELIQKKLL